LSAIDHPDQAAGQTFNCGDPVNWSLREWAEIIVELSGAQIEFVSIPSDIAVEAATTLMPLGNTTAPHCVLSIEKAHRLLGHEPAIEPVDAMRETLDWYASDPSFDPAASPALTDRFDYQTEDRLIAVYRSAAASVTESVAQHRQPPIHSMPHPRAPGATDHRGR
ncbi:MAG: hypothetical protein J2P57_20130, partial [Acidimicrobiaceae bacterium]|nr:hypothetical protein [Acidimicrobiaceae bacterium]